MKKIKIIVAVTSFFCILAGTLCLSSPAYADLEELPITIAGYGYYSQFTLEENYPLWVSLFNPNLDPGGGTYENICSVEIVMTFPTSLLEVYSVDFTPDSDKYYSNESGTINFKATYETCEVQESVDLFQVIFRPKALGSGTVEFSSATIDKGETPITDLDPEVYSDMSFQVTAASQAPVQNSPTTTSTYTPPSRTSTTTGSGASHATSTTGVNTSLVKIATKPENSAFKTPTLTSLQFGPDSVLDKQNSKSKGAIFTGTGEPNSKILLLINSQSEIFTNTSSDATGGWSKTIDEWLEDGSHTVIIWSEKDNKISPKFSSSFVISSLAKDQIAIGTTYPESSTAKSVTTTTPKKTSSLDALLKSKFFWIYLGSGIIVIALMIILIIRSRHRKKIDPVEDILSGESASSIPNNQQILPPEPPTFQAPAQTTQTQTPVNNIVPTQITAPIDLSKIDPSKSKL